MERVATLRGIDGDQQLGHVPAIGRLLRTLTAAAALSVAGTLDAQEPASATIDGAGTKVVRPAEDPLDERAIVKLVEQLDADAFIPRQEASRRITDELWKAFDTEWTDAATLLGRIEKDGGGKPRAVSPEQKERVKNIRAKLAAWRLEPSSLGKLGVIRGDAALHEIRKKALVPIDADDETMRMLAATEIDARGERDTRMTTNVLASLCRATKTIPMPLPNGEIRLVPMQPGESVASSKDLIGIVRTDDAGAPYSMSLQMEPGRGAILAFIDEEGRFAPSLPDTYTLDREKENPIPAFPKPIDLDVAANGRSAWKGSFDQKLVHRTKKVLNADALRTVVANDPVSERLDVGAPAKKLGVQCIGAPSVEETPSGEWKLTVVSNVCGEVPWPPTPGAWDVLTYTLANANRYVARDEEGVEMHPVIESTEFNARVMTVKIVYPRKPADLTVHGFSGMDLRMLDLPVPVTPPAPPAPFPSDPAAR
jgi:hypothetical protein